MIRILVRVFFCLSALGWVASAGEAWRAGTATAMITPEHSMWMAGYAARTKPSEGTTQDLFAKALALEDAKGHRLVIVTLDLIGVPRALRKNLEIRAQKAWELAPEFLLINASHTHSGPEFRVDKIPGDDQELKRVEDAEKYGRALEEKLFQLIGGALSNREPARISYGHARAGFAMNRRLPTPTGYQNRPNPDGVVDHDVPVLRVADGEGKLKAILFGYACHNTTLALYQFCGDYAGFAQEYLQSDNPGVTAHFLNGCSGDQNPYPRGTVELARQHGRTLATAVEAALGAVLTPITNGLQAACAEIDLPYAPLPTREDLVRLKNSKVKAEQQRAGRLLAELDLNGKLPTHYPYPVQVIHFGNQLSLVALGGETVVDFSLRLKRELAGPIVWMAGYSNDVMTYIPSRRVWEEGGYEAREAILNSRIHPGPWSPDIEDLIVAKVHDLDRSLGGTP